MSTVTCIKFFVPDELSYEFAREVDHLDLEPTLLGLDDDEEDLVYEIDRDRENASEVDKLITWLESVREEIESEDENTQS